MITSTSNSQMKTIVQLNKKSKTRRQLGVFVVEGLKMVLEAPREWVQQGYVSESFLEQTKEHKEQLQGYSYEVVSDSVFKSISDTQTPQGILCLVKLPSYSLEQLLAGDNSFVLSDNAADAIISFYINGAAAI